MARDKKKKQAAAQEQAAQEEHMNNDTIQPDNQAAQEKEKEKETAPVNDEQASTSNVLHIRCCHPGPIVFMLNGSKVVINGSNMGIEVMRRRPLARGEFGRTVINKHDWEAIVAKYGHKKLFKNEMIKAFESEAYANDWADGFGGEKTHGLDPVKTSETATQPMSKQEIADASGM